MIFVFFFVPSPVDFAVDFQGRVYILSQEGIIYRNGKPFLSLSSPLSIDSDGFSLWVLEGNGTITRYDGSGRILGRLERYGRKIRAGEGFLLVINKGIDVYETQEGNWRRIWDGDVRHVEIVGDTLHVLVDSLDFMLDIHGRLLGKKKGYLFPFPPGAVRIKMIREKLYILKPDTLIIQ